jgi:hypothetical protein
MIERAKSPAEKSSVNDSERCFFYRAGEFAWLCSFCSQMLGYEINGVNFD